MLIHSLQLDGLLSFAPGSPAVELRPLNVLIGPNGSGKSNFLDAIGLLQAAPGAIADPIRQSGGTADWIWKGEPRTNVAGLSAILANPLGNIPLRYEFKFRESNHRFDIVEERIENEAPYLNQEEPYFYYKFLDGNPVLNMKEDRRNLRREQIDPERSIIAQRKDPDQYPEITYLAETLPKIAIYRDWTFGRNALLRQPQKADLPNDTLAADGMNLGLILNRMNRFPQVKRALLEKLHDFMEGITNVTEIVQANSVQVFLEEGEITIPASRLSDGTIRYLYLLAILLDPTPPPLICLEEPELGLHPDILPGLGDLLKDASQRTQLVVTTHSDILVDALTETPEAILVCEKHENGTEMTRLNAEELKPWLEKYRLGELWIRGDLGGMRW